MDLRRNAQAQLVRCSVELAGTIYIPSMPQLHYDDNDLRVSYLVDESVLALTHAIAVAAPRELLATGGPGIFPKLLDPVNQLLSNLLRGDGQKFLSGRGFDQNPIFSHYALVP